MRFAGRWMARRWPLLRGDELISELEMAPGPRVGTLLQGLAEAQYAGEISTRAQALAYARRRLAAE